MTSLPRITITRDIARMAPKAWKALCAQNQPLRWFAMDGGIVEVQGSGARAHLVRLGRDDLRHRLRRCARWRMAARGRKKAVPSDPPLELVKDMLADYGKPLPIVDHVARTPGFLPDGTLLLASGYDEASRTLSLVPEEYQAMVVNDHPTVQDVANAKDWIVGNLLVDFEFVSAASLAHTVGLMLVPLVRRMIDGPTPLHLITKPQPGAGASLLAEVCMTPTTTVGVPIHPAPKSSEEWRKTITATLLDHPAFVIFDNVSEKLSAGPLAAALTTRHWTDRRMGVSENVSVPIGCAWIATGNNPGVSSELSRRIVAIRLDPQMERPWERTGWRHPLPQWAIENRIQLLHSLCTLVCAWIAAGQPVPSEPTSPLGRYESYSEVIGGILETCGIPGFLSDQERFYESHDDEGDAWRRFVAGWFAAYGVAPVRAVDLLVLAEQTDGIHLGQRHGSRTKVLGHLLRRMVDRQFGDLKILVAGSYQNAKRYRLQQFAKSPDIPPPQTVAPRGTAPLS